MARLRRRDAIDESTVGVYHCVNRCVRQAFLCGIDSASGTNDDHRKTWIQERLEFLAGEFAIDVGSVLIRAERSDVGLNGRRKRRSEPRNRYSN